MKRRKIGALFFVTVLILTLFSACSTGNKEATGKNNTTGGTVSSDEKITLRFSWWGGEDRHAATIAAIEAYKQIAPNVTIEAEYQGFDGYEQKIKTQLAGGTSADIMQLDLPWLQELTSKGDFFLDLGNSSEFDAAGFDQDFLNNFGVYNDQLVAVPTGVNSYCMIINKTLADKLGIQTDVEWDWDSIYEAGKKLHEEDSSKYLLLADHAALRQDIVTMLKQRTGAQWVNEDYTVGFSKEDAVASFEWLHKAMEAGVYQPIGESDLFFGKIDQNPKWINQEIPMAPSMSSTLLSLKNVLPDGVEIVTSLPVIAKDAKDTGVLIRPSQLFAISNKSKHQEEASKFLSWFMNDKEAAAILGDVRSVPPVKSSQEAAVAAGKIDAAITNAVELGLSHAGIVDNSVANNSEVQKVLEDIIQKVSYGKSTPEEAADELIASLTSKLKEIKDRK
ncbi:carbohydrate ABC transporter substrate-binding protein [Paenibacillus anaericanus]|uniref:Carbohydrate ABC transporter substrate-binding protein n=1 Tax=Paenibacillus anaericanus TaxID=170367 RepID=A0A433Y6G2_9BACL|nr:ABC transporter substrate-binding protein [Paenibacillus anaericanus]RUT44614.1 carbohydrate ABC transporter substrate-binding protein [Paenibacillus anaericanus]